MTKLKIETDETARIINKSFVGHGLTIPVNVRDNLIEGLSDYFEKEYKKVYSMECQCCHSENLLTFDAFNKQQFKRKVEAKK